MRRLGVLALAALLMCAQGADAQTLPLPTFGGSSGGSGTPGGASGTLQYNNAGAFGGISPTDDSTLIGNGTDWQVKTLPDCDDSAGQHLNYDTGTNAFTCGTTSSGGTINPGVTNVLPKYTASTTLDDSLLTDNATTLTYTGTGGVTAPSFQTSTGTTGSVAVSDGTNVTTVIASTGMNYCLDAVGTDAYACNISPAIAAYVTGGQYVLKVATLNTGAATVNFNALGAKSIVKVIGGVTSALATGDILAGQILYLTYDGTNMQLQSTLAAAVTATSTTTLTNKTLSGNTATNLISGSGTLTLNTTGTATVPNATDTLVAKATTDTLTNKTLDAEGTGNVLTISTKIWLPAAACDNVTATTLWDMPTTNAPAVACITGTNTQKGVLDFDATTDESAQMTILLPSDWTGAIDARVSWLAAATTGAVGWCVQLISTADGETDDPAFPAQAAGNCVSDTTKGTTLQTNIATLTGITATGVAAGELLHVRISRDANGGAVTDDMTGDARLIGVELTIRRAI